MDVSGNSRRTALVLLSGLPGAGKTTFAARLCLRTPLLHLESDAVRRELFPVPRYEGPEHAKVFAVVEGRARKALSAGRDVLIDATNLTRRDRTRFVRLAVDVPAALVAVRLTAPDDVIRKRLTAAREGYSQAGVAVYEAMRAKPEPFTVPVVTVDSRFELGPSVELVAALVENG